MSDHYDCPWCGSRYQTEYDINLHIEEDHTEDSPFTVISTTQASSDKLSDSIPNDGRDDAYVKCTRPGCGQRVPLDGIDAHLVMHEGIGTSSGSHTTSSNFEPEISADSIHQNAVQSARKRTSDLKTSTGLKDPPSLRSRKVLSFLSGRLQQPGLQQRKGRGRLGKSDLGQYAFEKSMPSSLRRVLENAAMPVTENTISPTGRLVKHTYHPNETAGLIPILADLSALNDTTITYLCHNEAKHIHRIKCDGNFCGYWNIQMLLNYVLATTSPDRGLPTVLQIQDIIENAWSNNICAYGKVETGGILNTRKWIGTHEALAFFRQLDIAVSAQSFQTDQDRDAHAALLDVVEVYFLSGLTPELEECNTGSVITRLPPIYLQRAGHSLTIVGLSKNDNGERSLLVFDPSHDTTSAMRRLVSGLPVRALPGTLLEPYKTSQERLARWDEYETLMLVP